MAIIPCDGRYVSKTTYAYLYSVMGDTWTNRFDFYYFMPGYPDAGVFPPPPAGYFYVPIIWPRGGGPLYQGAGWCVDSNTAQISWTVNDGNIH